MFLVTAAPHSGAGWLAAALTAAGIPTGHEDFHGPYAHRRPNLHYAGDVAWPAALLPDPAATPTVRLRRDPTDTITSITRSRWLDTPDGSPAARFVHQHAPHIYDQPEGRARAAALVDLCDQSTAHLPTYDLTDLTTNPDAFWRLVAALTGRTLAPDAITRALQTPPQGHHPAPTEP